MRVIGLGALLSLVAFAETASGQVALGVRAGAARARQVDPNRHTSLFTGVNAGAVMVVEIQSWLSIQGELTFAQKGWQQNKAWQQNDIAVSLDYFEVPVLARLAVPVSNFRVRSNWRLQPFMVAGVAAARLLDCATSFSAFRTTGDDRVTPRPPVRAPQPDFFTLTCREYPSGDTDFGLVYGGGLSLQFGRQHVTIEARLNRGTRDLRPGMRALGCECGDGWLRNDVTAVLIGTSFRRRP